MKNLFIVAILALATSCTPVAKEEAADSTAVAVDTVVVQSVNPGVEGTVPVDTIK